MLYRFHIRRCTRDRASSFIRLPPPTMMINIAIYLLFSLMIFAIAAAPPIFTLIFHIIFSPFIIDDAALISPLVAIAIMPRC